ncbi:hypothetical protein GCM10010269_68060 [Streptomyces humidus]|uniref:Uncharacterized protein n=1 Tax=Streptomyces humidus TaxID=52259 RepID=A0A918G5I7_9ACTN|nr:hypothetical protein GCM10010269_68060 [Streptomyces humidus]
MAAAVALSEQVSRAGRGPPAGLRVRIPRRPGRSARTARQAVPCPRVRPEPVASPRARPSPRARIRVRFGFGVRAGRGAVTGRDLTQIVGPVEAEGSVGAFPDGPAARLPYG